jgi:hypothetical protein
MISWTALGIGSSMGDSSIIVAWVGNDGNVVVSDRRSSGYSEPQLAQTQSVQLISGGVSGNTLSFTFSRSRSAQDASDKSISTQGNTNFLWAIGNKKPSGTDASASITEHSSKGSFSMNVNVSGTGSASSTSNLLLVHGIFMFFAWALATPIL